MITEPDKSHEHRLQGAYTTLVRMLQHGPDELPQSVRTHVSTRQRGLSDLALAVQLVHGLIDVAYETAEREWVKEREKKKKENQHDDR